MMVIVTRYHPGDIRRFTAVSHMLLETAVNGAAVDVATEAMLDTAAVDGEAARDLASLLPELATLRSVEDRELISDLYSALLNSPQQEQQPQHLLNVNGATVDVATEA